MPAKEILPDDASGGSNDGDTTVDDVTGPPDTDPSEGEGSYGDVA